MLKLFTVQWRHVATGVTEDDYLKTQCHHLFVNKETKTLNITETETYLTFGANFIKAHRIHHLTL